MKLLPTTISIVSSLTLAVGAAVAQQAQTEQEGQQGLQTEERAQQEAGQQSQQQMPQDSAGQSGQSLEQIARNQPDDLKGKTVRSTQGEEIGEIEELVRSRDNGEIHAVISSGGFLGIGEEQSAVQVSELEMEGEAILYTGMNAQEELEQQSYEEDRYEPIEDQRGLAADDPGQTRDQQGQQGIAAAGGQDQDQDQERRDFAGDQDQEREQQDLAAGGQDQDRQQQDQTRGQNQDSQGVQEGENVQDLARTRPHELEGIAVVDESGNEVGEVKLTVVERDGEQYFVVVSSDEFLGLGGEDVVISVDDLQAGDNNLRLTSEDSVEVYTEAEYLEVQDPSA